MRASWLLAASAALALGFAPAPFPKAEKRVPRLTMAGTWVGEWANMPVQLDFRPDGSARFQYLKSSGAWDGRWRWDPGARRVTLTLFFGGSNTGDYLLAFSVLTHTEAEGKILDTPTAHRPLKLARSGGR